MILVELLLGLLALPRLYIERAAVRGGVAAVHVCRVAADAAGRFPSQRRRTVTRPDPCSSPASRPVL
jgi:hypothetical protein